MNLEQKLSSTPELKAFRWIVEAGGAITCLLAVWRWIESGSLAHAIAVLLPFLGWATLAVAFLAGAALLILGTGLARLACVLSVLAVAYVASGLPVAVVGMLSLLAVGPAIADLFVGVFRRPT